MARGVLTPRVKVRAATRITGAGLYVVETEDDEAQSVLYCGDSKTVRDSQAVHVDLVLKKSLEVLGVLFGPDMNNRTR